MYNIVKQYMYLKSIELYGFKSFAGKSKISLQPNITGIIGPNGCGKSNVVDAVKWCIGEMSWKELRLPSMSDVIFTGTARRQPLNIAEVTLTFDNESGKLPFNFREVAVTRKIYRSDESEYFINKVQCRLKDIREMFLDTGIGSAGYAIIDQGEVEFTLSANPRERRNLFEEAAGVSKYKAKREEALKKLEKVDMDMGRLADSMQIINENIKKLDAEAKKARLQQKYQEEMKEGEMALFARNARDYILNIKSKEAELEPVNRETDELSVNLSAMEGEAGALDVNLTRKREEERLLQETVSSLKTSKAGLEAKISSDENLVKEIKKQMEEFERLRENNERQAGEISPRLEEINLEIKEFEKKDLEAKAGLDAVLSKEKEILDKISGLTREIELSEKKTIETYDREKVLSNELTRLESEIAHLKEYILALSKENEVLKKEEERLEADCAAASENFDFLRELLKEKEKKLADLGAGKTRLENSIRETKEKSNRVTHQIVRNESRLEALTAQGEKDPYWVGMNAVINARIQGVRGTLRHLTEIDPDYILQAEESLSAFMDAVICDDLDSARKAVEYLDTINKGRVRIIVLDKIGEVNFSSAGIPNAVEILNKIKRPPELENLLKLLLSGVYASRRETFGPFWITGGIEKIIPPEPYWREEENLKDKISKGKTEKEKLGLEISSRESEMAGILQSAEAASREMNGEKINFEKTKARKEEIESRKENIRAEIKLNSEEAGKKENEAREKENLAVSLKAEMEELKKASNALAAEMEEKGRKRGLLSEELNRVKEELGAKKTLWENEERNLRNLENERDRLNGVIDKIKNETGNFLTRKKDAGRRIAGYENEITGLKDSLEKTKSELSDKEMLQVQFKNELRDMQSEFEQLNAKIKEIKEILSDLESRRHAAEMEINADKTRLEDLKTRFLEDWNVRYEDVAEKYPDPEVDEQRLQFLKKRIENMGPINMTAPQEYDALINRYNFLNSQVEDLNEAKSDLKSAISKINETTRVNFKETFEKVKAHFGHIYSILFNGGEANLVLTEPENLLETGVEIMAHPPGKKLVSISQLSGGEKALTALALLFSFFCVNPSPFCIMDEADAPLDEVNTERFSMLIKEFSKTAQFILITHNKKTMEIADILYGITMEEMGVSKLVSMDLKKASEFIDADRKSAGMATG